MKNFFLVLVFVGFGFGVVRGQVTLEGTLPTSGNTLQGYISVVKFGYLGEKFVDYEWEDSVIKIFSLNYVLEKTITIPMSSIIPGSYTTVWYISDDLFDLDSSIEYLVYVIGSTTEHNYVFKEDGSILLDVDSSLIISETDRNLLAPFGSIFPTSTGTKLLLRRLNGDYQIYSLPGFLHCYECSGGSYTGNSPVINLNQNPSGLSNPFPNPTSNLTRIDYQLPNGIKSGELVFYNTLGNEVKRLRVTSTFSFIYVSPRDLPSATYYYNLQTSSGESDGKKIVVIR